MTTMKLVAAGVPSVVVGARSCTPWPPGVGGMCGGACGPSGCSTVRERSAVRRMAAGSRTPHGRCRRPAPGFEYLLLRCCQVMPQNAAAQMLRIAPSALSDILHRGIRGHSPVENLGHSRKLVRWIHRKCGRAPLFS